MREKGSTTCWLTPSLSQAQVGTGKVLGLWLGNQRLQGYGNGVTWHHQLLTAVGWWGSHLPFLYKPNNPHTNWGRRIPGIIGVNDSLFSLPFGQPLTSPYPSIDWLIMAVFGKELEIDSPLNGFLRSISIPFPFSPGFWPGKGQGSTSLTDGPLASPWALSSFHSRESLRNSLPF